MTGYHARDIAGSVFLALENMPVVVLTGMRQTGKTTFLRSQGGMENRAFLSFDDFAQREAARADPDGFLRRETPVTIDEAQKCPEIFDALKRSVDLDRTPGRFLLSGSANFSILESITESLAGRSVYLDLCPFNRRELHEATGREPFLKRFFENPNLRLKGDLPAIAPRDVLQGGMPTVCLGQVKDPEIWFRGYEQTYLERDVRELSRVGDLTALRTLLRLIALRTGQLRSPTQLGRDAKLNAVTVSRYLSLFEASFLIHRVPPYLSNRSSRLIKSPKVYMTDAGLAAHLAGVDRSASLSGDPLYGPLFETYVAQNLRSILNSRWQGTALHFWMVQGRHEVDFVIDAGRSCLALELKSAARWRKRDLSGLEAFLAATPHCRAAVLCHNGPDAVRLGERLWALPAAIVLS